MKHEERLALGRVCGCGECEYCEDVVIDDLSKKVQSLINEGRLTAQQATKHYQISKKEYTHQWLKSK